MPVPVGATVVLSPQEGVGLVWGGATRVYNFFSQNNLHMTTAVYMANCSVVGGDCEGWRASMQSFHALRQSKGYTLGSLTVGYPGRSIFSELLSTEYGTRWLGILAVASTLPDEIKGARGLHVFLKQVASDATTQLILGMEQCERIWTLARQIFADSPYWYEFLRIIAKCADCVDIDVMSLCFLRSRASDVDHQNFFATFMTAAYRLWELSQSEQMTGQKLWAQGSVGCGQLILYLTLVCGFHVTVRSKTKDVYFGGHTSHIEVVIAIKGTVGDPWTTGYLMEDLSVVQTTEHLINRASESRLWRPGMAAYLPINTSLYHISEDSHEIRYGEPMLTHLQQLKRQVQRVGIEAYVSKWITHRLLVLVYYYDVKSQHVLEQERSLGTRPSTNFPHKRTQMQVNLLFERLSLVTEIFAPGMVGKEDLEDLWDEIRSNRTPQKSVHLLDMMPRSSAKMLCDCSLHGGTHQGSEDSWCEADMLVDALETTAWKIWMCAYSGVEARVLRDVAPDYLWQLKAPHLSEKPTAEVILTRYILESVASRLAGRTVRAEDPNVIGLAAGGFVVSLLGHEDCSVKNDPGHLIHVVAGSIEAPERSITEVVQYRIRDIGRPPDTISFHPGPSLMEILEPCDLFGPTRVQHFVQVEGSQAKIASVVAFQGGDCPLQWLLAIDNAPLVNTFKGCLGICASGRLTTQELSCVEVLTPGNVAALGSMGPRTRLQAVLAHENVAVTRAALSCATVGQVMIQVGTCTHCAVRAALTERIPMLIC